MQEDQPNATGPGAGTSREAQLAKLADLLVVNLEALARLGQADAACRGAGKACAVLRGTNPVQWRKFNALLHRLSRHVPDEQQALRE
jgi:hypothetical protein